MEKFKVIAERFVEYLKEDDFDEMFQFTMNDGLCDFIFGIKLVNDFDTYVFVVGMYGDCSCQTYNLISFNGEIGDHDWNEELEYITEFFYEHYNDWTPVISE